MRALVLGIAMCAEIWQPAIADDIRLPPIPAPSPAQKPRRQVGRVIKVEVTGGDTLVTVAIGTDRGIDKYAKATLVTDKDSTEPIPDGDIIIIRVDARTMLGKTHATVAQIQAHRWVSVEPGL